MARRGAGFPADSAPAPSSNLPSLSPRSEGRPSLLLRPLPPLFLHMKQENKEGRKGGHPDPLFILTSWLHALLRLRAFISAACVVCYYILTSSLSTLQPSALRGVSWKLFSRCTVQSVAFSSAEMLLRRQPFSTHFRLLTVGQRS